MGGALWRRGGGGHARQSHRITSNPTHSPAVGPPRGPKACGDGGAPVPKRTTPLRGCPPRRVQPDELQGIRHHPAPAPARRRRARRALWRRHGDAGRPRRVPLLRRLDPPEGRGHQPAAAVGARRRLGAAGPGGGARARGFGGRGGWWDGAWLRRGRRVPPWRTRLAAGRGRGGRQPSPERPAHLLALLRLPAAGAGQGRKLQTLNPNPPPPAAPPPRRLPPSPAALRPGRRPHRDKARPARARRRRRRPAAAAAPQGGGGGPRLRAEAAL